MLSFRTTILFLLALPLASSAQVDSVIVLESNIEDLNIMIIEALTNNPEIQAAGYQMDVMAGKAQQAGTLEDPELRYMREEMPDFRWNEAMFSRIELMQMLRFPTKLFAESKIGNIRAEHAHHEHLETINQVLARLKSAYYELWLLQQNIVLARENVRLMKQFAKIAESKYGVGQGSQQDALKASVEAAKMESELVTLRQQESGVKAMLMAILNRSERDTIGFAVVSEEVVFTPSLDTLKTRALENRPMLKHDSLGIEESHTMLSLSKQEYLPDLKFGLQYVTGPTDGFRGWSVIAGISLPFAPWTLGKASGRVNEAEASVKRSTSSYNASRNMVLSSVSELYYKVSAAKKRLDMYRTRILPQAQQSLDASTTAYQTGSTDFLMLLDAYRTLVDLRMEYYVTRMQFEKSVAELEWAIGYQNIRSLE